MLNLMHLESHNASKRYVGSKNKNKRKEGALK